jgi:hypothetical protein
MGLDELVPNVLGTAVPDDDDDDEEDDDDNDGESDPNNDCGRFAITETLKYFVHICCATFGSIFFWFFLMVCSGLGFDFLVFSLVFNMAPATFRVIKYSDFRIKSPKKG